MKRYFILLVLCAGLAACNDSNTRKASPDLVSDPVSASNPDAVPDKLPEMKFENNIFDFGTIDEGAEVQHSYSFTNKGNTDLLISNATASCGCTVPSWPKQPIRPGESGQIDVKFDSHGKMGKVEKSITITANTRPNQTILIIKGEVNKKSDTH